MNKDELIEEIIGLVKSIKATREETARIKQRVLAKMHELETLQRKREAHEADVELEQALQG